MLKRTINTVLVIWLVVNMATSQTTFSKSIPYESGNDSGWNVLALSDGYLIASGTYCLEKDVECTYLVKVDLNGEKVWEKIYGNFPYQLGVGGTASLVQTSDSSFHLQCDYYTANDEDRALFAFDDNGDSLFLQVYSENKIGDASDVILTPKNDLVMLGTQFINDLILRPEIICVDLDGKIKWRKVYIPPSDRIAIWNFDLCNNGDMVFSLRDTEGLDDRQYIYKVDSLGYRLWHREYNERYVFPTLTACLDDGGYLRASRTDTLPDDPQTFKRVDFVERYTANHQKIWRTDFVGTWSTGEKQVDQMKVTSDNYIVGIGAHVQGLTPIPNTQSWGAWIFKMDLSGEILWERSYFFAEEPYNTPSLVNFDEALDGGYICSGSIADPVPGNPNDRDINVWLLKLDEYGCLEPGCQDSMFVVSVSDIDTNEKLTPVKYFYLTPNPSISLSAMVFYTPVQSNQMYATITDLGGKVIDRIHLPKGQQEFRFNVSRKSPGIYQVSLFEGNRVKQIEQLMVVR